MPALVVSIGNDLEELRTDILELRSDINSLCSVILTLRKEVLAMALSQADFDTELAEMVAAVDQLIAAVEAIPPADLTAEGQAVMDAAARVRAELDHLNPAVPTDTGGGETPPPDAQPV